MKRIFTFIITILFSLSITGCGWTDSFFGGEDNSIPPTELEDIVESVQVRSVWSQNIGVGIDDSFVNLQPAMMDSNIFTVDREGQVTSLSSETGNINWQVELEMTITGGIGAGQGLLFVGNHRGEIIVLDADNGSVKWQKELSSVMLSAPIVQSDVLMVRTGDGRVFGLNADNGNQIWVYDRGVPVLTLRGNSSPLIGGRELVFTGFDSGKVAAVGVEHGRLLWEANASVPRGRSDLERLVDIDGNMLLIGRVLYAATYQGRIVAIDALKGEILWAKEMSAYAGLTADERYIYVTDSDSNLWAVDRVSGNRLWKQDKLAYRKLTAPVSIGKYILVGDFEGYVHIISQADGELIGREKIDGDGFHVQPQVNGNTVFIYGNGGKLAALQIN
ncbi:MAG: outer membrane protein assembly factor BamB [gamma proteobacterium symbiont of Bathyaustriella thionipta]|nr:outer membrane protein assembly factor BamB [gamma proteobacterium symbiont of Bathyaustriella thionipta]MCU7949068.1 outer membrane protein assembly factor BamB [gamma proteobacterium symbiont of Bathyaustriella thionipta]MCU7952785.1 outer membrane protein assembly factor BamB [gamma proteobacterium symbiont of Bathyaustriella thionipta]MCU7955719.1 outer membrane protein assembly factor BamB [gamma proteobacterium symbiont of Bathyaustriella thionipta]MCU7967809.1 outer membrane protein a